MIQREKNSKASHFSNQIEDGHLQDIPPRRYCLNVLKQEAHSLVLGVNREHGEGVSPRAQILLAAEDLVNGLGGILQQELPYGSAVLEIRTTSIMLEACLCFQATEQPAAKKEKKKPTQEEVAAEQKRAFFVKPVPE